MVIKDFDSDAFLQQGVGRWNSLRECQTGTAVVQNPQDLNVHHLLHELYMKEWILHHIWVILLIQTRSSLF